MSRVWVDHVVVAVTALDDAARRLARDHGLDAAYGGEHPGRGTANRIVALADAAYLELITVVDADTAHADPLGRAVAHGLATGGGPLAWALATDDLDELAASAGLAVEPMTRRRPDGVELSWRVAGLAEAYDDPSHPILIAWDVPPHAHPSAGGTARLERLAVSGDPDWLPALVGELPTPVALTPGPAAVLEITIAGPRGTFTIGRVAGGLA